jgi:polar amino acid transport system substrate-binding protein
MTMAEIKNKLTKKHIIALCAAIAVIIAVIIILASNMVSSPDEPMDILPPIKIGHSQFPYPPLHYYDDSGTLVGFDIDLANAAAAIMGFKAEFVPLDWSENAELLVSGEVDMLWGGLERVSLDNDKINFTKAYLRSNIVLLMNEGREYSKWEDLQGLSVCALNFTPAYNYLQAYNRDLIKSARSFTPPDYTKLLDSLSTGEFDCMITDTSFASFFLKLKSDETFIMSDSLMGSNYAVAVRTEDTELFETLQKALDELEADGTIEELRVKWMAD